MLTKKNFLIIVAGLVVLNLFAGMFYINSKNNLFETEKSYLHLKKKLEEVKFYQSKYGNINKKLLNKYCQINNKVNKLVLNCKELNKNGFDIITNEILNKNIKINKFQILSVGKNKTDIKMEILK